VPTARMACHFSTPAKPGSPLYTTFLYERFPKRRPAGVFNKFNRLKPLLLSFTVEMIGFT